MGMVSVVEQQKELAGIIERFSGEDGVHATAVPSLHFIRASREAEPVYTVHKPALCIVAQGSKVVILGQEEYRYDRSNYLVVSIDLPISGQIVKASPEAPYLCMRLDFSPEHIVDMAGYAERSPRAKEETKRGLFVGQAAPALLDAVLRLVRLLDTPEDIAVLAPLCIREILYRLSRDEQGASLLQMAATDSHAQRIADVISLIKRDYDKSLRIEVLSEAARMSSSSLYYHFKEVTAMSPLQYQKQLRLQEARRLMLAGGADAADAGFRVGYESPSQFSREYARLFGQPPMTDVKRLLRTDQSPEAYEA